MATYVPTEFNFSRAVITEELVFLGHHRGYGDSFLAQLEDALDAVGRTLEKVGLSLESLVQVHVWLRDIEDAEAMEERFAEYFPPDHYPARMTTTTEFFDADCLVMIDGVAARS